ncbi:hypothetical protein [Pseudomonas asiatica]|uniref:hypothetical protein n=1 Tax=Pseudomonas asiatica TaxID=2219225 RepID=UPI00383B2092
MASWSSTIDIINEFSLKSQDTELESVREELKKIMSSVHPDRNGGNFSSEEDKSRFLRVQEALRFLELNAHTGSAMIPVSQLPAVINALSQALSTTSSPNANALQSNYMPDARARISRRYALPKIGSGVFAAVTGFLFAFPEKLGEHPILGPMMNETVTQALLLSLMMYSGLFFVISWYKEKRAEANAEYLMSESALSQLFDIITNNSRENSETRRVSSRQILEAVECVAEQNRNSGSLALLIFGSRVELPTIESAAAIQTQRLIERKVLTRVNVVSIDAWYDFHHSS